MCSRRLLSVVMTALAVSTPFMYPSEGEAQAFFVDASVNQAFASDPLTSPLGFSLSVGRTSMLGPLGVHAGLRQLYQDGEEVAQVCNFATCTPGPFDQSHSMRHLFVGLSYDFPNPTNVYLNLGLNVGRTQQTEHLVHTGSGAKMDVGAPDETTLGGSVDLRLRPLIGPLRPVFAARYDRILEGDCAADGVCFPARNMWGLSVGLSWVAPAR